MSRLTERLGWDPWVGAEYAERVAKRLLEDGSVFLTAEEIERYRRIEAAARAYLAHDGSGLGLDADNPWGGDYDGSLNFTNLRALRAALGESTP